MLVIKVTTSALAMANTAGGNKSKVWGLFVLYRKTVCYVWRRQSIFPLVQVQVQAGHNLLSNRGTFFFFLDQCLHLSMNSGDITCTHVTHPCSRKNQEFGIAPNRGRSNFQEGHSPP